MQQEAALTFCTVVAVTWFTWDCCLTFNDELEFMWLRKWSYPLAIFVVIRYLTLVLLAMALSLVPARRISEFGCEAIDTIVTVGAFLLLILVGIILQIRVYSMYGRSKRVLISNAALFIAVCACSGAIVGLFFPQEKFIPINVPIIGTCYVYASSALSMGLLPPLIFTVYLTILAFYRWREYRLGKVMSPQSNAIMAVLVHSNIAYLSLLSASIACVLYIQIHLKLEPSSAAISLITAAAGIGGTRLTLSLRKEVLTALPFGVTQQHPIDLYHHNLPGDDRIVVHTVTTIHRDEFDMDVILDLTSDMNTRTLRDETYSRTVEMDLALSDTGTITKSMTQRLSV